MIAKKSCLISFFLVLIHYFAFSQAYFRIEEEKDYELKTNDVAEEVLRTNSSVLIAGETKSLNDYKSQILLINTDYEGKVIWQNAYGSENDHFFTTISENFDGSYNILGEKATERGKVIIMKLIGENGTEFKEIEYGGNSKNMAKDVIQSRDGGYIIVGSKEIKGDNDIDGWIIKFNRKGKEEWMRLIGNRFMDDGLNVIISDIANGNFIAGYSRQKIRGPKIPFISQIDERGNPVWKLMLTNFKYSEARSLYLDKDGFLVALLSTEDESGMLISTSKAEISVSGNLIRVSTVPNPLSVDKNKYLIDEDGSIIAFSASNQNNTDQGTQNVMKLDNEFLPVWQKNLQNDFQSVSVSKRDLGQYLLVGFHSERGRKSNVRVIGFKDYSSQFLESFVNQKLTALGEKSTAESMSDFKFRVGTSQYNEVFEEYSEEGKITMKFLASSNVANEDRSSSPVEMKSRANVANGSAEIQIEGKYYALFIAVNDYDDPLIADLDQPINDAHRLYDVLIKDYFFEEVNMSILKNPKREEIIEELDRLSREMTKNDNLLVFYAGHSYWDEVTENGYWLPADARKQNTAQWIRNSTISGYIRSIPARHTLLVADACFSGSIFKTRSAFSNNLPIKRLYDLPSRKAMTSGTLKEVPDKSVFIEYMIKRLKENEEKLLPSEQLFFSFKPAVLNNSQNIPQFGVVSNAGDEGGDFIFIRRN